MKKIIFNKLIIRCDKIFFFCHSLSLSLIILVVQAVNFLDYISEDGHGIYTYFGIYAQFSQNIFKSNAILYIYNNFLRNK